MTLIDRDPLIAEYQQSLKWLYDHVKELDLGEFTMQTAAVSMAMQMLKQAPVKGGVWDETDAQAFDVVERHKNCTVEILRNSLTGEESVGWWENEEEEK